MDYQEIVNLCATVISNAIPIGIIIRLSEYLVQMFLSFAIPKFKRSDF